MLGAAKKISLPGLVKALVVSASRVYPHPTIPQDRETVKGMHRLKDKAKYCLRGLVTPQLTRRWFQLFNQPELAAIARTHPRILSKLQRPYLHRKLRAKDRLKILQEHYRFALEIFSPDVLEQIYSKRGALLADLPLEDAGRFSLRLLYGNAFEKEGELTVALVDEDAAGFIFALSFTVSSSAKLSGEMFIGGLQSFKAGYNRDQVVAITRAMHGLRPKALLLFAVQQLAAVWNIQTIRAVSNEMSVFRDFRLRKKKIMADYDEFWLESEGRVDADGLFTLPTAFTPRPIPDIKPNKRSLYKKRYVMLDEVSTKITANARQLGRQPQTP